VQKLLRQARKGARLLYLPGNHDEFLRDYYGTHFGGIEVIEDAGYSGKSLKRPGIVAALDALSRHRADTLSTEFDEERHSETVADEHPEAALQAQSQRAAVRRAIAELPPEFREVIVLRELEGLSYKEISDVAGVPVGTVMSRLSRARRRLEDALCAEPEDC